MLSNMLIKAHIWATNKRAELEQEEGQTLVEYTLIIGVVVVLLWGAIMFTELPQHVQGALGDLAAIFTGEGGGE